MNGARPCSSDQRAYTFEQLGGGPDRTRTCGLRFRKPPLYPSELRGRPVVFSATRALVQVIWERRPKRNGAGPVKKGEGSGKLDPRLVPRAVLDVLRRLSSGGHEAWLVGGGVRDLLREKRSRPPKDWDIATAARPDEVMRLFRRVIPTGVKHGTVTVLTKSAPVEVTTFRGEAGYTDARRPDRVEFIDRIEEDLARRDFTINAIAWNPFSGELRDPFGGMEDLRRGLVRAVRDPLERFTEDGLRPMRAVRLACVLEISLEEKTAAAIPQALGSFGKVAIERVRQEIERIMLAPRPSIGLALMRKTGLLESVIPELAREEEEAFVTRLRAIDGTERMLHLRLAILLSEQIEGGGSVSTPSQILEGLRFPRSVVASVETLLGVADWRSLESMRPADRRRILARVGLENAKDVACLWRALASSHGDSEQAGKVAFLASELEAEAKRCPPVSAKDLAITGREIMSLLGLGPGPKVGEAISYLLDIVIEDPRRNEPDELRAALEAWWE